MLFENGVHVERYLFSFQAHYIYFNEIDELKN